MKKTVFMVGLVFLFSLSGPAQTKNVDIDSHGFAYAYRALPTNPLDPVRFTYTTKIIASGAAKNNVPVEDVAESIRIQGQIRVDDPSEATVRVELILGNIIVSSSDVIERKEESKDKKGNILGTKYYYRTLVNYSFESSYRIRMDQKLLTEGVLYSRMNNQTYQTQEYASRKEAANFWNNNREALIGDFYGEVVRKSIGLVSSIASRRYGFSAIFGQRDVLKITDEKKHNENVPFRTAVEALKEELQAMTPDIPLNRERIEGLIDYFKRIPAKYPDPQLKADVRIRYAAYFNLAKIYYYLDEPEKVKYYADLITSNGYDAKDGEKQNRAANELKAAFDKTGIHTTHFLPDAYFILPLPPNSENP